MDKEWLDKLTVITNDIANQDAINLDELDLCEPDNRGLTNMPNPHRPNTIESIYSVLNSDKVQALTNNPITSLIDTTKMNDTTKAILKDVLKQELGDKIGGDIDSMMDSSSNTKYDKPIDNFVVIEFGDDYTLGDKVDYELYVKPGETINSTTLIGNIILGNKQKLIRSIFNKATIMKNEDDTFYHIYPSACDRHIVLQNIEYGTGNDFNVDDFNPIMDDFKQNSYLYNLITTNLCYSVLPLILSKREEKEDHYIWLLNLYVPHICPYHNGEETYTDFIEKFEDKITDYQNNIADSTSEECIKNTRGSVSKMNSLVDDIKKKREELIEWVISYYRSAYSVDPCQFDEKFNDCRYLAWGTNSINSDLVEKDLKRTKIGKTTYGNYYMLLLSRINVIDEDKWSIRYYDLISEIIATRLQRERYSTEFLITEFNKLYKDNINSKEKDAYSLIANDLNAKANCTISDVQAWMNNKVEKIYSLSKETAKSIVKKKLYLVTAASTSLVNIYWFIKNYKGVDNEQMDMNISNEEIFLLTCEEKEKLSQFWEEAISAYYNTSIDNTITKIQEYTDSLTLYAEWPAPVDFQIEGITYKLFEFQNPFMEVPVVDEEFDIPEELTTDAPNIDDFQVPAEVPDNYAATMSDNDPELNEINPTMYPYWVKYFTLATIISIPFLADGLDIPTPGGMIPVLLPCIYICLGVVYIKMLDLVIVIGLAIRGVYFWPVILGVNLSLTTLSMMIPLVVLLKMVKELFYASIELIECMVPNIATVLINKLEAENAELRKKNNEYGVYYESLKNMHIENIGKLKNTVKKIYSPNADLRQVYTRQDDLLAIATTDADTASEEVTVIKND